MKVSLARATKLMTSKRSERAIAITGRLLQQLKKSGEYDTPFGLNVRFIHGSALIHADTSSSSYDFLWELKAASQAKEQWDVFAGTCRVIASLLEYVGREEESLTNLREAQIIIREHRLDSIYPAFAVRISSWHRIFGSRDSSIFYAQEAIRTAGFFGKDFEAAEGHLLLGLNYATADPAIAISHFKEGARLYRKIEEFTSYCNMYMNIIKVQLANNRAREAIASVDSALAHIPPEYENNIIPRHKSEIYMFKGQAFQQLRQLDSAVFYLSRGYEMNLSYLSATNTRKIIEIDNKYNVDQKAQELMAKNLEIKREKERRNWLATSVMLLALFISALTYYYLQLRKANDKTKQQAQQLKNLDAAKNRFFSNISHELRTPLTLLLGPISSLAKENRLTDEQSQLLKMATHSGQQLEQLVNEILDLGKLEFGKMDLQSQPVLLIPFFRKYFLQFESLAVRKQVQYDFRVDLPDGFTAVIDPTKCRQIIYNLLSNAFKFTPADGQVSVMVRTAGQKINQHHNHHARFSKLDITVTNSGAGIHPDDLPHVFDRYFQTNRPEATATGGSGIGLALCQEYARLFGGTIDVKSTPGQHTTFRVGFPVEIAETEQSPRQPENLSGQLAADYRLVVEKPDQLIIPGATTVVDPQKPTILVVEDNFELQDYIRLILRNQYNVVTANNGRMALQLLAHSASGRLDSPSLPGGMVGIKADLILSDLMMPVMDGYQLLEKLKADKTTQLIPVIMLTARAEVNDRLKALRIGVDDYLTKPFAEEELLVRIDNLLANYAVRKELEPNKAKAEVPASPDILPAEQEWLKDFEEYVSENLSSDTLGVPMLALKFAMSESTLLRQLKRLTGLTPQKYLYEIRLNKARQLLETRQFDSVAKVASEVGYTNVRSFSRSFKGRFGKAPSDF